MIFDELRHTEKLSTAVAKQAVFEKFKDWMGNDISVVVDEEYLDVNIPDHVHFVLRGSEVVMLSRRKLNEEGLGKHLIYHPNKPKSLKLSDIINQTF